MLKDSTLIFIKKHWENEEDYAFFVSTIQYLINKFKESIVKGEFKSKEQLFECIKAWLNKFEEEVLTDIEEKDKKIRIYNCFAFTLINELLEDF